MAAEVVFNSLVKIDVGNGKIILFWKDRWLEGRSAMEIALGMEG
jgi:hypothetical protein